MSSAGTPAWPRQRAARCVPGAWRSGPANPAEYSSSITAVLLPDGFSESAFRAVVLDRFNMSLGAGLGKIAGKVFRIGHLGDFNDLMLAGTLAGVEMGLELAGIPHRKGGINAALDYLTEAGKGRGWQGLKLMMPEQHGPGSFENRWVQLAIMVLSTVTLSNMQYGWTLFVNPMRNETHWATAGIQLAFSILIFLNTWLAPLEGWVADRYGPRFVVMLGGLAAGTSWVMNSRAHSLQALYVAAAIGGLGIGCVFGTCMGTALKWFPERRGFASGMIAAGYGLGAAITVIPTSRMILASGYRHAFFFFGLLQGVSIFCLGAFLIKPPCRRIGPRQRERYARGGSLLRPRRCERKYSGSFTWFT